MTRTTNEQLTPRQGPCIYCNSTRPITKREHVMPRALGTFEHNWTLDCVCDECNQHFADNLELPLGRDSREAIARLELGLKPPMAAAQLLSRRVKTSLEDPGQFGGIRLKMAVSEDGTEVVPVPVPQVGFRREHGNWVFLTEAELTPERLEEYEGPAQVEIRIHGIGADCDRLKNRLAAAGIEFLETHRMLDQPLTEQDRLTIVHDINVDETIVRAACKIAFNYSAKVLGPDTVRRSSFNAARRFVRYGDAPTRLATVQKLSIITGAGSESARLHACGLGWDRGYLVGLVSLFNEITYGIRLSRAEHGEYREARHFFDPLTRTISEAGISS